MKSMITNIICCCILFFSAGAQNVKQLTANENWKDEKIRDGGIIKQSPSHVVIIDDTAEQLMPGDKVFKESSAKVSLVHYPAQDIECAEGYVEVK